MCKSYIFIRELGRLSITKCVAVLYADYVVLQWEDRSREGRKIIYRTHMFCSLLWLPLDKNLLNEKQQEQNDTS